MSTGVIGRLADKRILVTGAGRGIGSAIARICYDEGAKVAIASRTQADLEETASSMSRDDSVLLQVADITKQKEVERMVKAVVDRWGGIDILINNAGRNQSSKGPSHELSTDDLRDVLELNVVSVHMVAKEVISRSGMLEEGGSGQIVNVSSRAGKLGIPNMSFYVASKFALEGLTATMAAELKEKNIRVNSISPGMVDTQGFPKRPGQPKVRTAESIRDGLLVLLESEVTGHYLHVDELDMVRNMGGMEDTAALKPINETMFSV